MEDKTLKVTLGSNFTGVLFIVFLVLKLCGVISWSWWWVTAPLWAPVCMAAIVIVVFLIIYFIRICFAYRRLH